VRANFEWKNAHFSYISRMGRMPVILYRRMPITLSPISRRQFVKGSLAAATASLFPRLLQAAPPAIDPHRFILLSDIHIDADPNFSKAETKVFETFAQAAREIIASAAAARPSAVLINGDLTHHQGNPEDYATVIEALKPLRAAGLPLHMTMGNHDNRDNFFKALPRDDRREKTINDHQTLLIETPRANFFILDSLNVVAETPGLIGPKQLAWLKKSLDARPDKPAIVFTHHDPDQRTDEEKKDPEKKLSGLIDTKEFLDLILPRKQVKAYLFGHTHVWGYQQREGIHCINLPPTAWIFKQGPPRGWVDLNLSERGAIFELRSLDTTHPQHGKKLDLKWR
jgi:Icc protein